MLGGFSQGVALAVEAALARPLALLLLRGSALEGDSELPGVEVLAHHGRHDRLCEPTTAWRTYERRLKGARLRWVVDETLGHGCARGRQQLCAGELREICGFLRDLWGPLQTLGA